MQTADLAGPAASESVVLNSFRMCPQHLAQSAQMILFPLVQLAVKPNQAPFKMRKFIPRRCRHFNCADIGVHAIQHACYSIQCIAESALLGRELAIELGGDECRTCFVTS